MYSEQQSEFSCTSNSSFKGSRSDATPAKNVNVISAYIISVVIKQVCQAFVGLASIVEPFYCMPPLASISCLQLFNFMVIILLA